MKIAYQGRVVIATPFYNMQAWSPYVLSLVQTTNMLSALGIDWQFAPMQGDSYVQRARNTICAKFLEDPKNTDLFFIDSDEAWEVAGFIRVLLAPQAVIGASYPMKNNWEAWTAQLNEDGGHPVGLLTGENSAIIEASLMPAGFLRLKREALEKFRDAYPELRYRDFGAAGGEDREYINFFECRVVDGLFNGEDASFSKRWSALGEKLYIDPNVTITHYGVKGWEGNLDKTLRESLKQNA